MGKIFGALVFYVFGFSLVSCSTSKPTMVLSNSDPYSDRIAKILENKGWPEEVIAVFRPFQFGTYSYSVTGDSLFLKANLRNDIVQKSWYVKFTF